MKPKQIIIGIIVLCVGLGVLALVKMRGSASGADESGDENITNIITVQVGILTNMTLHGYVDGYGTIEAAPATADQPAAGGVLAAPAAGVVYKVNAIAGQHVEKGDVLVGLNSGTATFDYAEAELDRQKKLYAQQNTSLKNVQDAEAQLASLQVASPVSGTVTRIEVKPGQAVDTSTTIAEVIDLNRLALSSKISASQANDLQTGQDVQILSDPPVTASLSFVSPAVNTDDGTVLVWASLPSDSHLRPGQFVQFKIATDVHTNCLAAPAESVVTDDDGNSSLALINGNEADQTTVQVGLREDDWVEVTATNLNAGGRVVTVGAYGLPDKTQIKIVNPAEENSATNSAAAQ
jgi:membrane fusion protein, multidrug efflux system